MLVFKKFLLRVINRFGLRKKFGETGNQIIEEWGYDVYRERSDLARETQMALIEQRYENTFGGRLDWDNPKTFSAKVQWSKFFDANPRKTILADKYKVRDEVEPILLKYGAKLIPLLGVWDSFDEIDFDALPQKFVLKTNHASGTNLLVEDKATLGKPMAKRKMDAWLKTPFHVRNGFETHYKDIVPKIIAEEYMVDLSTGWSDIQDYKIWCFDGKVHYIFVDVNRSRKHERNGFDAQWNELPFLIGDCGWTHQNIEKPSNLDTMIKVAEELSAEFSFVRVDLYEINNTVYFGEMTFTPASGFEKITPSSYNQEVGNLWTLPAATIE